MESELLKNYQPSTNEVKKYIAKWNSLSNYNEQEEAINKVFKQFPQNDNITDILIKSSVLNKFSSTNVLAIYNMSKNILNKKIDIKLKNKDLSVIDDIANIKFKEKTRKFYSFATKYCSYHEPEKFAIYDSYVEKTLKYFIKRDNFQISKNKDLKNYPNFMEKLKDFKNYYKLDCTQKELDQYLWQLGKESFPKKYNK